MISFIQRYLIYVLLAVIIVLLVSTGIQYVRFLKANNTAKELSQKVRVLEESVSLYKEAFYNAKATEKRQQEIKNMLVKFDKRISNLSQGKCLNEEDEKYFTDLYGAFNDGLQ